jgi:surface polysaccharide O-acyltransferase-like enzyme
MPDSKPQLDWINNLRVIAMYAVVVLHTASPLIMQYGKIPVSYWFWGDFYNGLSRFGVPVFVMITGALLLHRDYELGDFLKKRLGRIIPPFIFWSLVYVAYAWYNEDIAFGADAWANIKQVLHMLKYGSAYHLWYVYMLIGLYFLIPVITKFVRNATDNEVLYFLLVWFAVMMISQPYLARFNPQVDLHYFAGYAGYLVLGHYLAFVKLPVWLNKPAWFAALFFISLAIIVAGTYLACRYYNGLSTLLYEPISPTIVLLSASVFMLARVGMRKISPKIKRARDFVCSYTFGIYLSHALILMLLDDLLSINYKFCTPLISIPLTALICFILSLLLVYVISKLPFGKWVSA